MHDRVAKLEEKLATLDEERAQSVERVDLLNELVLEVGWDDPERAAALSTEAYELSRTLSYGKGIARGILNQGVQAYFLGKYEESLAFAEKALIHFRQIGDRAGEGDVLEGYGFVFWGLGDYGKALGHFHQALEIVRETGNKRREAWIQTSMGGVYENVGELEHALQYHERSLALFREMGDRLGEGRALVGLGTVYQSQGRADRALECHTRALDLFRQMRSRLNESRALNDIGTIHQSRGDFDKALGDHTRALGIRRELRNKRAETTSLLNLGRLHNQMGKPGKALELLQRALALSKETGEKPKTYQAHQALSEAYELLGDTGKALEHHKTFHRTKEEVFGAESNIKLKNLQIRFEVERAEKEAEIHRLKNIELADALERLKATQAQLIQSEKMAALGKLIAGVAHEVNSPTGVIASSMDVSRRAIAKIIYELNRSGTLEEARANADLQRYLAVLRDNNQTAAGAGKRIHKIVENLKKFARLDEAELQRNVDVQEGIASTLALIEPQLKDRITVVKRFDSIPRIECYPHQLNQLFMTLLVNAAEAIEDKGTIVIGTSSEGDDVVIEISDTGRGIPRERLEKIFEVGFSTKDSRMRMHVGLANCYAIVQKHKGDITVRSEIGTGTVFRARLPVRQP